ncbi:enoyl-CoA hydratase/isomerase family protein [Aliifodinibius salicampi]|uniref:Enoyl-CoA hydratase/isomerase family protein n=1 Tax=Fodinibius salicampi TaxID=1920655 RepID=A0ABT3PY86_9BACT|nr:enoyl-CoA hydratase/isomerase family protein [Fodinibius salicampi]MCW9712823.1 enoyl-CoA hydratase/isomerase family protein [Fodinibius salicampi]
MPNLKVEFKNNICQAVVNRPEKHNAVNFEVIEALEDLIGRIEKDEETRCLILKGAGSQSFISGGDLREFHTLKKAEDAKPMAQRMVSLLTRIEKLPCWTIASINGAAYGGGCEIMLAFDFRIASFDAVFGFTQSKFYLPPGWGGLTRLVERVGRSTALRWLGAAKVVNAKEALRYNLVDRLTDPKKLSGESWEWAEQLTRNDRAFIKNLKEQALQLAHARWKAIESELDSFAKFWESDLHHKRVQKFLDRKED